MPKRHLPGQKSQRNNSVETAVTNDVTGTDFHGLRTEKLTQCYKTLRPHVNTLRVVQRRCANPYITGVPVEFFRVTCPVNLLSVRVLYFPDNLSKTSYAVTL